MAQRSTRKLPVVLIAETRPTIAAGFKTFLANRPELQTMVITTGFDDVVDYAEQHEIGLIIVGQGVNWATPLSEFRRFRQQDPSWRLVMLANASDRVTIMAGLSAGASGIIPTSVEETELHTAITRILAGSIYIPNTAELLEPQHRGWHSRVAASAPLSSLTPRQFEVLGVLAQGNSNKQIAQILAISDSTVSMHLNAAFHALGVHDRTSAALAYRNMDCPHQEAGNDWSRERSQSRLGRHMLM